MAHPPYELALIVSAWLNWAHPTARPWLIAALVAHFVGRAWSLAYFIPRALRFEKMRDMTEGQRQQAKRWVRLSRIRPFIEIVSIVALGAAIVEQAGSKLT